MANFNKATSSTPINCNGKRIEPPGDDDSETKRQMVNAPQKGDVFDMVKLKKLVGLTASVKIDIGESAKCLSETKVSIGIAGETSNGKSSLLNALLGTAAMPMSEVSCTAYPVKVSKVAKNAQAHKYKLVLPPLAAFQGPKKSASVARWVAEKTYKLFSGDDRTVESDNIKDIYKVLNEDFGIVRGTEGKVYYHVSAQLTVAEEDPLGLVLLDTPGPTGGNTEWTDALVSLDGSSNPLIILPMSCKNAEMRDGGFRALCDANKNGKLGNLQIIVAFTFIDKPFQHKDTTFEDRLKDVINSIKSSLGERVIHFALVQCMGKDLVESDLNAHRRAERETLDNLPEGIKNYPGMIKGVAELEEVLVRLYLKRWDVVGLRTLKNIVDGDFYAKKTALEKMTKTIASGDIVLRLVNRVTLTDQQAGCTDNIYGKEILRHARVALEGVNLESTSNIPFLNSIFGCTSVQLEFQDEKKMREAIQSVLHQLKGCIPEVVNEMFRQYQNYVSYQTSTCPDTCQQLHEGVLALLNEFAVGTEEHPGVITNVIKEAQEWFTRAQSGTKLRGNTKSTYGLQLPEKWSGNKGLLAQRMLEELSFTMGQLHWNVCMIFFCGICDTFPEWLNARLLETKKTWSSASQEEIAATQEELNSLARTKATLDEIMELLC